MRAIAVIFAALVLLCPAAVQARVSVEDMERIVAFICGEDMNIASHADNAVRESCKAEFIKDGKRYEVAYWAEREERFVDVRRRGPPVKITTVDEWLTYSIIELSQLDSPDTGRIREQWMSIENRSGEIRSGMHGYAFEGGFNPPFDRYDSGDALEGIPAEGAHLKSYWQEVVDNAAHATLDHFRALWQETLLR